MSLLKFYKMEGAGNDFVVIDNREMGLSLDEIISITPRLTDRKFGIGADGLLALERAQIEGVDYTMVYRNADGSNAGMCGNGSRCLALFAAHHGFGNSQKFNVHDAIYHAEVDKIEHSVSVLFPDVKAPQWIEIDGKKFLQVYTGTEHVVTFEKKEVLLQESELVLLGRETREHPSLNPPGSNVNFVCIDTESTISVQTYERGVENLTLACGTGAMASAISTHFNAGDSVDTSEYIVEVKGGTLKVSFFYDNDTQTYTNLKLIGPANFVFEGSLKI